MKERRSCLSHYARLLSVLSRCTRGANWKASIVCFGPTRWAQLGTKLSTCCKRAATITGLLKVFFGGSYGTFCLYRICWWVRAEVKILYTIPFLQERVENGKKSFPSAFFHAERKHTAAVSTWAPSDSAAEWKRSLHPRCLFYESAEKQSASRNMISTGHLCISEPLAMGVCVGRAVSGKRHHCLQRTKDSQRTKASVGFKTGNNGFLEIITSPIS